MTNENSSQSELQQEINDTVSQYVDMISMLNDIQINQIPYKDSWTAGQLLNHVTKSTNGMVQVMKMDGKPVHEKDSFKRVPELKSVFLDFSIKMKSPEFIVPDAGLFEKQQITDDLLESFKNLDFYSANTNLDEEIDGLPFGPITKYELLHFVLYHTQRHLKQLKRIYEAVVI